MVILIVEDELLIGMAVRMVLRVAGYRVHGPTGSVERALELADQDRPDLAFVDVNLNGAEEGIGVARELHERHGATVIFLTAQPERAREARDIALGVIAKPFDPGGLVRAVEFAAEARAGKRISSTPRGLELFA